MTFERGAIRVKLHNARLKGWRTKSNAFTGKWLTIKTNVCPVWGIKARAAWRAKEKGE